MAIDLSADARIFQYFAADSDGQSSDYATARTQASEKAFTLLKDSIRKDYSIAELLSALYQAQEVVGDAGRQWVRGMLEFVKAFKPDFESVKNRFVSNGKDAEITVDFDDTVKTCLAYVEHLVNNSATGLVPGLTINQLFSAEKLQSLRDLYAKAGTQEAIQKLKSGQKLGLNDRTNLQELFSMAPEVMKSLDAQFADLAGESGSSSTVLISEESLTSLATRTTTRQTRRIDDIIDQVRNLFDAGRFVR